MRNYVGHSPEVGDTRVIFSSETFFHLSEWMNKWNEILRSQKTWEQKKIQNLPGMTVRLRCTGFFATSPTGLLIFICICCVFAFVIVFVFTGGSLRKRWTAALVELQTFEFEFIYICICCALVFVFAVVSLRKRWTVALVELRPAPLDVLY